VHVLFYELMWGAYVEEQRTLSLLHLKWRGNTTRFIAKAERENM